MTKRRSGVYLEEELLDRLGSYARHRGVSRNRAIEELLWWVLCREGLEVREELVEQALANSRRDFDVGDGNW